MEGGLNLKLPLELSINKPGFLVSILVLLVLLAFSVYVWRAYAYRKKQALSSSQTKTMMLPDDIQQNVIQQNPPLAVHYIEFVTSEGESYTFNLDSECINVGRGSGNDLVITSHFPGWNTVSRNHAQIYKEGTSWRVRDLGASNGTYVNGKRTGHNLLKDGWKLSVGRVTFIFHKGTEEAS